MQDSLKPDDARALLQSTQRLRTHWSGVITTHIGYAIAINVAIWSFFLKSYVDYSAELSKSQPLYILLAAAISAILLGIWRLYTHDVDNHIAGLYPDFLSYESVLKVPSDRGTSGYLIRAVPKIDLLLLDADLTPEQKLEGTSTLVKSKSVGRRGHLKIDLFTLFIVLGMFWISYSVGSKLQSSLALLCFSGIMVGALFILIGMLFYQKNPSKKVIDEILLELKDVDKTGA